MADPVIYTSKSGESNSISDWSKSTGIKLSTLRARIKKGMTIDEAIEASNPTLIKDPISGDEHTIEEWAQIVELPVSTIYNRLYVYHWPIDKALHEKKNTPVKEERDSSSDIKKVLIDDRVELFKTHLEVPDSKRESQQIIFKHKRLPKITKGIVHLEDLASEDKIIYHAKLVEKVGSVYYEFNTKVWSEEAEINNSNEMKANKISELIKAYRKKEVNNINKGKLGIQTKLKMNEDVMKSKKIYNNLLHLLRQK